MFSLIITIVSVALVAALAVATIYYGSDAAEKGRISARAGAIVSAGEQVAAGLSIYRLNTGRWPDTLETMVTEKYLNGLPEIAAADSLSFIASAHAAPAVEGDWLYDPDTPHLAYVKPISLEVCAEVNRRISGRRMVLNVLDPGIKVQCAAAGGDPVVVFRNSEVPLTTPPAIPGAPSVGSGGEFGEVGRVIDTEGEDTSGRCVYACEPGGAGSGEAGEGTGGGGDVEPPAPPPQAPVSLEPNPENSNWVQEGSEYCSPELPDDDYSHVEFHEVVAEKTMRALITGERYVSSEADDDVLSIYLNWESDDNDGGGYLKFSGEGEGWVPFSYSMTVPEGASIYVAAGYGKGESGAAGEDRACLRNISISFEEAQSVKTVAGSGVCATGSEYFYQDGYLLHHSGMNTPYRGVEAKFMPSCSPARIDPSIAASLNEVFLAVGDSEYFLDSYALGQDASGDLLLWFNWPDGSPEFKGTPPGSSATVEIRNSEGERVHSQTLTLIAPPALESFTRVGGSSPNLIPYGIPEAQLLVGLSNFQGAANAYHRNLDIGEVLPAIDETPYASIPAEGGVVTIRFEAACEPLPYSGPANGSGCFAGFGSVGANAQTRTYDALTLVDTATGFGFTTGLAGSDPGIGWAPHRVAGDKLDTAACSAPTGNATLRVSREEANNIVLGNKSASRLLVTVADLPEAAPHQIVPQHEHAGMFSVSMSLVESHDTTPAEIEQALWVYDLEPNHGLKTYTYAVQIDLNETAVTGSSLEFEILNRFGAFNPGELGRAISTFRVIDGTAESFLSQYGPVTCGDFDPDVVTLPDGG